MKDINGCLAPTYGATFRHKRTRMNFVEAGVARSLTYLSAVPPIGNPGLLGCSMADRCAQDCSLGCRGRFVESDVALADGDLLRHDAPNVRVVDFEPPIPHGTNVGSI